MIDNSQTDVAVKDKAHAEIKIKIPVLRNRYLLILDIFVLILGQFFTATIVDGIDGVVTMLTGNLGGVIFTVFEFLVLMYIFGIYSTMWRYGSTRDYAKLIAICIIS